MTKRKMIDNFRFAWKNCDRGLVLTLLVLGTIGFIVAQFYPTPGSQAALSVLSGMFIGYGIVLFYVWLP